MLGRQIRLVALDLDGTFLDANHQVSPANARAVRVLKQHGVPTVLVTGRRFRNVARIAQQYGLGDLAIVHNGALIRSCIDGALLYFEEIESALCRDVIEAGRGCGQFPFLHVNPSETRIYFERRAEENRARGEYIARNSPDMVPVDNLCDALDESRLIQMMFTHSIAPLQACRQCLLENFSERATILETCYPERDHVFIDVIHANCSKGKALQWLMNRESLLPSQVMAFGDNHNDLEMLQVAGHSFLMDNAAGELKRYGFRIAPRNDDDGVAKIIGEYWGG
jgi:hypothetical protein